MVAFGRGGAVALGGSAAFAQPSEPRAGNNLPAWTGSPGNDQADPGPHPSTQLLDGQVGKGWGTDPAMPETQPAHVSVLGEGQESFWRYGTQGFNDQLQVRDRHVYWDRGRQLFGWTPSVPGNPPNPHSDGPARASLRAVNISVNPQIGSDASKNQDDLARPYTWLGQQDGSVSPVYGGVPGLYTPYGSRGGVPYPVVDPTNGQGGPAQVASGPPHGLHSNTIVNGQQIAYRYEVNPQMQPPRMDRPANSPIAGQSYSQTVQMQSQTGAGAAAPSARPGLSAHFSARVG